MVRVMRGQNLIASILVFLIAGIVLASGCTNSTVTPLSPTPSNNASVEPSALSEIVVSNNLFALDMYRELSKKENDNIFFSPYSILTALSIAYEGARGKTAEEMRDVLHIPVDNTSRREGFRRLILDLTPKKAPYELHTANALWIQKGYPIKEDYINVVRSYYLAELQALDFSGDPEGARKIINEWVEKQTNKRIRDLIPSGAIDELTRLVITNAIYFKANWASRFRPEDTHNETFILGSGEKIKTEMMHQTAVFNYTENDELQALEIPYEGNRLSMVILLPRENKISALEKKLTPDFLKSVLGSMKAEKVEVTIPKFKFETLYKLNDALQEMGMREAFTPEADFSGITEGVFISMVIHKSFISVAENGTEAAAATAVTLTLAAPPGIEKPKVFKADHPFIFLIYDRESDTILFMGRLANPKG